jgi:hypothetical protein
MFTQELDEFFRRIKKSFKPKHYNALSKKSVKSSTEYLFSLIILSLIIMAVMAIPRFLFLPSHISSQLEQITEFTINTNVTTTAPVYFPNLKPFLILDTSGNIEELEEGNILITDKKIQYKFFNNVFTEETKSFKDLTQRRGFLQYGLLVLLLLLIPVILLLLYLIYAVKYIVLIFLLAIAAYMFFKVFRHKGSLKQFINAAIYSSSIFIIIEIVSSPLGLLPYYFPIKVLYIFNISIITTALFFIYYIIVIYKMMHEPKGEHHGN